ncbi:uncharacterized protein LMH87_008480 [Akanthomyces muscarius]|uniref:Methyltransferase domain-containing protein n=1 Tax=Akanthomyces muscarius TaxID=2231603 RepID=A0A9W8ULZ9_AKAMU|nr:uncharacterized protein LMH87_008480 [Akanthomyces muscarius]KAJ4157925.1 hypothetical protein LMH87_008480 [Akanthomyces muscarius]
MASLDLGSTKDRTPAKTPEPDKASADPPAPLSDPPSLPWLSEEPPVEPAGSEEISDDEFVANSVDSDLVSVSSSVYAHTYERGRRYQSFKNSRYPIPNDDIEQAREDMKHVMLMELTGGKLLFAPIGEHPQKIVDIGTGTGIWAIETGDAYPSASILGIDLTPIQPLWVPPNVEFIVDDCEQDWLLDNVDLAHFRFMAMILKDVPLVMQHAYESLRPGGWIEFQELLGRPYCDDDTMKSDDPFKVLYEIAGEAYQKLGLSTSLPAELEPVLLSAGFENIHCKVVKVPIGTWAKDKTLRLVGLYQKTAVTDFISTLAGRPFKALGLSEEEAQVRLALARQALDTTDNVD